MRAGRYVYLYFGLCFILSSPCYAVEEGDIAPDFTLPSLVPSLVPSLDQSSPINNYFISLSHYSGKVVVLEFWSVWCLPCRNTLPSLARMRNTFSPEHFELVSIDIDVVPEDARLFLEDIAGKVNLSHPIAMDPQATTARIYQYSNIPTTYLINRQGVVEQVHKNFSREQVGTLAKDIRKLINRQYRG